MHVIATAGHVDHGKSALLRALTGMEPDRWAEERRRGMTIDLGFVWTRLPAAGDIAFVDVPGHERLVGNMLAGAGPVPAVLFVVAADQGWQQQSEEHLAILDALGVRHGILAVTRSDLADPHAVRAEALARIEESSLGKVPSVDVSAVTGRGLDTLRDALARLAGELPTPDHEADVRLWVDRAFTVRGHGTVVTGTLGAGTLRVGDRLQLARDGSSLRVRGLECLKEPRQEAGAVARVAVNVSGPGAGALGRGDALLTPDRWLTTDTVDVRLRGDPASDLPRQLTLHLGSSAVPVTVRPLGEDTARLRLGTSLPLRVGDGALLRDPGRHSIPAGVTVLDVRPPRLTRRGAAAARDEELRQADAAGELRRRGLIRRSELLAMGVTPPAEPVTGDWLADPDHWASLRARLGTVVEEHAARHPLDPGLPLEAARRALGLPERSLVEALSAESPELRYSEGRLYGNQARPTLPPRIAAAVDAVRADLAQQPFRAPEADRLAELGLDAKLLAAAEAAGALLRIDRHIVLLPGADAEAAAVLAELEQPFTTSQARRALDTTRRVAVPLLEYLDRHGRTERLDGTLRRCREPR
ncbi:selenocysteine-specific translation elongation factor [Streptomyces griseoluteus]|uniref:selenocysteine-specific translation elongation factor n=1 Tax=Streptomyces griseoluteus TaxID=29306 RepID=UPI0033F72DB0